MKADFLEDLKSFVNTVVDICESTNDIAKKLGEAGCPHGTWISARSQTKGRGRLGRVWESGEGNLFLSILLRWNDENRAFWSWVPMTAAIGVAKRLDLQVKWPNDLWLGGAKAGGILCEAVGNKGGSFIVLGLGLNCAFAPSGLDQPTSHLTADVDKIRPIVIEAVMKAVDELAAAGPAATIKGYKERAAIPNGTVIEWGDDGIGIVDGLGESGELIVKTSVGSRERLYAEDVKIRLPKP